MVHLDEDCHRYLSLTGVAMEVAHAREKLEPACNLIKSLIFDQDPDDPIIFHRSDIMRKRKGFEVLNNPEKSCLFDEYIMNLIKETEYTVITAMVDKKALLSKLNWRKNHPYHFLMEILIEKYAQFLERQNSRRDIMPEGRKGKKDKSLESAFKDVCREGTYYVPNTQISERLTTTKTIKFRYKSDNIAGQQLCDLLAYPSHMYIRSCRGHDVRPGLFSQKIIDILTADKYDRSKYGKIRGYGIKFFP